MSYLMRDVPATRYQLLDRPGSAYPATRPAPVPTVRNKAHLADVSRSTPPGPSHMSTEEQLARYLQEAYGSRESAIQELQSAVHQHVSERW